MYIVLLSVIVVDGKPLNAACAIHPNTQDWLPPFTRPLDIIDRFDWPNMVGFGGGFPAGKSIVSIIPTFYPDEPDHNQSNKPRLDILVSVNDGATVRYHPSSNPIWSHEVQPTEAVQKRYNLAAKLRR